MAMVAEAIFTTLLASLVASRPKSVAGVLYERTSSYYIYENKRVKERRRRKKRKSR